MFIKAYRASGSLLSRDLDHGFWSVRRHLEAPSELEHGLYLLLLSAPWNWWYSCRGLRRDYVVFYRYVCVYTHVIYIRVLDIYNAHEHRYMYINT